MYKPQLKQLTSKTKMFVRGFGGGVNNGIPAFEIKDNEVSDESNMDSRAFPATRTRLPRLAVGTALTGTVYHLGKRTNSFLHAVTDTAWKYWTGSIWSSVATLTGSGSADSADFVGKTIFANGSDKLSWDGSSTSTLTDMPTANMLAVHANRLYAAWTGNNVLAYSALRIPTDWTTPEDAGTITIETADGDFCTGLKEYANHIMYFKKRSIHELYGTAPLNYSMQQITNDIGCVSHKSIAEVAGVLFWLGEGAVYGYGGGTTPRDIGYPNIQGYLNRIDSSRVSGACAGSDGTRYYLCIPVDTSAWITLVYSTENKDWHVEDSTQYVEFCFMGTALYGITAAGQIQEMANASGSETRAFYIVSKPYQLQTVSGKKRLGNIFVTANIPVGTVVTVATSTSFSTNDFKTAGEIIGTGYETVYPIIIPAGLVEGADWFRVKLSGTVYTTKIATIHSIELQVRIMQNTF